MTPAQRLRAAAQLVRETAEAATPGPWNGGSMWWFPVGEIDDSGHFVERPQGFHAVSGHTGAEMVSTSGHEPDAAHIALWSPPVALAVAAWLEDEARAFDAYMDRQLDPERRFGSIWLATAQERHEHALAVADALLQTQEAARRQQ